MICLPVARAVGQHHSRPDGCRLEERRNEKLSQHWSRRRSQSTSPDHRRDRHDQPERDRWPHTERERGRASGLTPKERDDAQKRRREKEAAELDDEIDKRRKRIEAWQVCGPLCIHQVIHSSGTVAWSPSSAAVSTVPCAAFCALKLCTGVHTQHQDAHPGACTPSQSLPCTCSWLV